MWQKPLDSDLSPDGCVPKGAYDSSTIDSGFISEPNLGEDTMKYKDSFQEPQNRKDLYMRTDSGIISDSSGPIADRLSQIDLSSEKSDIDKSKEWESFRENAFVQDEDGDTFLHLAIMHHFLETVFSLIRLAPSEVYLDIKNEYWHTPLHIAVLTSQPIIVRRLVLAGASVSCRDRYGYTPLHYAAERGDLACVQNLLTPFKQIEVQTFAKPHVLQPQHNLDLKTYQGQTSAHLAAKNGHRDVLYHLWAFGANLNCREGLGGRTPLHYAVQTGDLSVAELLLKHCSVDSETENYAGLTAYQQAYICNHPIKNYLLDFGSLRRDPPSPLESDTEELMEYTDIKVSGTPVSVSG